MNLYIIRHANAVEAGDPQFERDSLRPLSRKGREKMKKIAQALWELEIQPELILSSPAVRSMETAKILAKRLDVKKGRVVATEHLEAGGSADHLIAELLEKYHEIETIALVGHEPYLGSLISVLVSGGEEMTIRLKKGGVCSLSIESLCYGRCAQLDWLLSPAQLVEIGTDY
jgi:phosphohistidine phosphatase